jgi:hypothetical protein
LTAVVHLPDLYGPEITIGFPRPSGKFVATIHKSASSNRYDIRHRGFKDAVDFHTMKTIVDNTPVKLQVNLSEQVILPPPPGNDKDDATYGRYCALFVERCIIKDIRSSDIARYQPTGKVASNGHIFGGNSYLTTPPTNPEGSAIYQIDELYHGFGVHSNRSSRIQFERDGFGNLRTATVVLEDTQTGRKEAVHLATIEKWAAELESVTHLKLSDGTTLNPWSSTEAPTLPSQSAYLVRTAIGSGSLPVAGCTVFTVFIEGRLNDVSIRTLLFAATIQHLYLNAWLNLKCRTGLMRTFSPMVHMVPTLAQVASSSRVGLSGYAPSSACVPPSPQPTATSPAAPPTTTATGSHGAEHTLLFNPWSEPVLLDDIAGPQRFYVMQVTAIGQRTLFLSKTRFPQLDPIDFWTDGGVSYSVEFELASGPMSFDRSIATRIERFQQALHKAVSNKQVECPQHLGCLMVPMRGLAHGQFGQSIDWTTIDCMSSTDASSRGRYTAGDVVRRVVKGQVEIGVITRRDPGSSKWTVRKLLGCAQLGLDPPVHPVTTDDPVEGESNNQSSPNRDPDASTIILVKHGTERACAG